MVTAGGDGRENSGFGFFVGVAGDIVDAGFLIQLGNQPIAIGVVADGKGHILKQAIFVCLSGIHGSAILGGEYLGQIDGKAVNVSIVNQGVIVFAGGTLPGKHHFIFIAVVAVDERIIGVDFCGVGNAQGVVGITSVNCAVGIGCAAVDLIQTGLGDVHGHVPVVLRIGDRELAAFHIPGGGGVGAVLILEELQLYTGFLAVLHAFAEGVIEVVHGQSGCIGGDGGQGGNDLVFQSVAGGGGGVVGVAIGDAVGAAVLTGVSCGFPHGLFQGGNAGFILGVDHHIIVPALTAILGGRVFIAGDRGHGQGHEEGVDGAGNHFRHLGFHQQVQTYRQVRSRGAAVGIGEGHLRTTIGCDVGFQCVLDGGGVGSQGVCQGFVQSVGGVIVVGAVQLVGVVRIFIASGSVCQTNGGQQVSRGSLVEAIQYLGQIVVRVTVIGRLRKGHDIRNLQVGKANALDRVTVAGFAVAQVVGIGAAQDVFHIAFLDAGGGEGIDIPNAVLHSVRPVILENGERTVCIRINEIIRNRCHLHGRSGDGIGQAQNQRQAEGQCFHDVAFHFVVPFLYIDFVLSLASTRKNPVKAMAIQMGR